MPKARERYVKVCPHCKSTDVSLDRSTMQGTGVTPSMYLCGTCEHSGYVFPEVAVSRLKTFKQEVRRRHLDTKRKDKTPLLDPSMGEYGVRVVWKLEGPLVMLIGIFVLFKQESGPDLFFGLLALLLGGFVTYIAYVKKREITRPSN